MKLFWSKIINSLYLAGQRWRVVWLDIWHEPVNRWLMISNLFFLVISWVLAGWLFFITKSGLLILHYNIHFGIDMISAPISAFFLPIGATIALMINSYLPLFRCLATRQLRLTVLAGNLVVLVFINFVLLSLLIINS